MGAVDRPGIRLDQNKACNMLGFGYVLPYGTLTAAVLVSWTQLLPACLSDFMAYRL